MRQTKDSGGTTDGWREKKRAGEPKGEKRTKMWSRTTAGKVQQVFEMCSRYLFRKSKILSEICRFFEQSKSNLEEKRLNATTRHKGCGAAALLRLIISIIHVNFTFICHRDTRAVHVDAWISGCKPREELKQYRFPLINLLGHFMTYFSNWVYKCVNEWKRIRVFGVFCSRLTVVMQEIFLSQINNALSQKTKRIRASYRSLLSAFHIWMDAFYII